MLNSECDLPSLFDTTAEKMDVLVPETVEEFEDEEDEVEDTYLPKYEGDVASYIGGFVIRRLEREVKCSTCTDKLRGEKPTDPSLTTIRDNGGLVYCNPSIEKVFRVCEKHLSISLTFCNVLSDKLFIERNIAKELIEILFSGLLNSVLDHNIFLQSGSGTFLF